MKNTQKGSSDALILTVLIFAIIFIIIAVMLILPIYRVWNAEQTGKAELARAEGNRKIRILEAQSNLEAEKMNAQAEIERAKGAASAIEIENGKLTETYIRYLWVRQQNNLNDKTVIYIPTDGSLPLLESTRLLEQKQVQEKESDQ